MGCNSEKLMELIAKKSLILTEGAVVERLRREFQVKPDEFIVFAGAIYDRNSREILKNIYKEYIEISIKYKLPIMLMSSTRRANQDRIKKSKYNKFNVNFDYIEFLNEIRTEYSQYKDSIFIGALIGTKGNSYDANEASQEDEAYEFHKYQCTIFKDSKADFIFAGVIPSLSEAKGLAKAIEEIDKYYNPMIYMVNCVHPKNVLNGLNRDENKTSIIRDRLKGIQANTSSLSPEELNNNIVLQEEDFNELISYVNDLKDKFEFNILGGCCGTNAKHIEEIARNICMESSYNYI